MVMMDNTKTTHINDFAMYTNDTLVIMVNLIINSGSVGEVKRNSNEVRGHYKEGAR
jgi:hypothetical protein